MRWILWIICAWTLFGCAGTPWRVTYLRDGVDKLRQDDVATRLGVPQLRMRLQSGGEVWTYRYYSVYGGVQPVVEGTGGGGFTRSVCIEYILAFDPQGLLRQWERQGC